jgi:catechol 2,3-dioxygenase-like lactoylglutathione lyase family enzyme
VEALFILYVKDQDASSRFYASVLDRQPTLHVAGMTEFTLSDGCKLGLMPSTGIKRLLPEMPDPGLADGVPRAEVYLTVPDPAGFHQRALEAGAVELSRLSRRPWGDIVAYSMDPDGHVLAFARPAEAV